VPIVLEVVWGCVRIRANFFFHSLSCVFRNEIFKVTLLKELVLKFTSMDMTQFSYPRCEILHHYEYDFSHSSDVRIHIHVLKFHISNYVKFNIANCALENEFSSFLVIAYARFLPGPLTWPLFQPFKYILRDITLPLKYLTREGVEPRTFALATSRANHQTTGTRWRDCCSLRGSSHGRTGQALPSHSRKSAGVTGPAVGVTSLGERQGFPTSCFKGGLSLGSSDSKILTEDFNQRYFSLRS